MWEKIIINNKESNYSVSDSGEIRNDVRNAILKQSIQYGYKRVSLVMDGKYYSFQVHRLVGLYFIPNPNNYPIINHIDHNRQNNKVSNLEWCSYSYNTREAYKHKKFTVKKPVNQYNLKGELIWTYESITDAANQTGTLFEKIVEVCERKRITTNQYQWRYYDDEQDVLVNYSPPTSPKKVGQYKDNKLINIYNSFNEAARAVNGSGSAICRICSGINKTHKGYEWKLVEDIVQELE